MKFNLNPEWLFCEDIAKAQAAQKEMAKRVLLEDNINTPIKNRASMGKD